MKIPAWAWRILGPVILFGGWELYGRTTSPLLFPPISRIVKELIASLANGTLLSAFLESMKLLFVGVGIGTAAGILLGLLLGRYAVLNAVLDPFLAVVYSTPRSAVVAVIILWFGLGFSGKVVIVFLTSFFEVLVATATGVRQISSTYIEVARSFLLPRNQFFPKVLIPGSISYILSGIRLGLGHGLVGVVVAELFMENNGIGGLVDLASVHFRTDRVMAAIITLAVTSVVLTSFLRYIEQKASPWQVESYE